MNNTFVWIELDPQVYTHLSNKACSMVLPMFYAINSENEIDKNDFIASLNWCKDPRTSNKYWDELENKNFLVHLKDKIWMVSPHVCYNGGVSHSELIIKWNEAKLI